VIHVYGIVDGLSALPSVGGIDDAPLECRRVGDLELVISLSPRGASAEVSRDAVLRHAQVVDELMRRSRAVLPAQFGRAFEDDDEFVDAVRAQAAELTRGLDRVRGCVEFGLRAVAPAGRAGATAESGASYMRARLEEVRRQDRLVAELHEPLARHARDTTLTRDAPDAGIKAAYLVPESGVDAFRETVTRFEKTLPQLTLV